MQLTTHHSLQNANKYALAATLCMSLWLSGCQKDENSTPQPEQKSQQIEMIAADLVPVQSGSSNLRYAFTGTLRAINQSSVQAQVSATATEVFAQVGQQVSKGQVLVRLNNQDNAARLAQSRANLSAAQAQAQQAANMVNRKKRLYDKGFISKVEYEQSQVDYTAQLENVKAQQANVEIAQKADQDGVIRSPISGVVTKRQVEPGQTVALGQTLFEIVDPSRLEIQASIPVESQAALKAGNQIEYTLQGSNQKQAARLTRVSPIADQVSRQVEFFAQPLDAVNSLSIGAFVKGDILDSKIIEGQQIPLDSIQSLDSQPFVWVVRNKKIQQVSIQVLDQQLNRNLAIVTGLNADDQVSRVKFGKEDINKTVSISNLK